MTRITLTAAALLIAAGTAFADSDKYDPNDASRPAVAGTDNTVTTSIGKSDKTDRKPVVQGSNRDLFGNH